MRPLIHVLPDEELVPAALNADHAAITELFTRHRKLLATICKAIAGDDGEDALQQVMVNFPQRLATYNPDRGPFKAWLTTVAKREAIHARHRSNRHQDSSAIHLDAPDAPELPCRRDDPADRTVARSELRHLTSKLSDRARHVIVASCVHGHTDQLIATDLGIDPVTVRTIRNKARVHMSKFLDVPESA